MIEIWRVYVLVLHQNADFGQQIHLKVQLLFLGLLFISFIFGWQMVYGERVFFL